MHIAECYPRLCDMPVVVSAKQSRTFLANRLQIAGDRGLHKILSRWNTKASVNEIYRERIYRHQSVSHRTDDLPQ